MFDFLTGLLTELSILAGITLFIMSFSKKYKNHKVKMITVGVVLVIIGIVFIDTAGISEAYQQGVEFVKNN